MWEDHPAQDRPGGRAKRFRSFDRGAVDRAQRIGTQKVKIDVEGIDMDREDRREPIKGERRALQAKGPLEDPRKDTALAVHKQECYDTDEGRERDWKNGEPARRRAEPEIDLGHPEREEQSD